VVDRFYTSVAESPVFLSCCICVFHTAIGIRAVASKMSTTTKFEVEKFDGKSNFLLWKMRVTPLLVKESIHKALLGIEKKSLKMEDDEWNNIDLRAKMTIILCLSDAVFYNVMNEETIAGFWSRLESLYMTKNLSNKLFIKKQLFSLQTKEGTPILQHLNAFNRILSDLLALEVKLEEDKALMLLSSPPSSYDHLTITIIYGKETLELKDVMQVLQNNELMNMTDSTEESQDWLSRARRGDQRVGDPKRMQMLLPVMLTTTAGIQGSSRKIV